MKAKLAILSLLFLLVSCGGGGGGGAAVTPILGSNTLNGVAAVGAPISGGSVTALDASGMLVGSAVTAASGSFTITLPASAAAPFMLQVSGGTYLDQTLTPALNLPLRTPMHSVALNTGGISNITPFSEMVLSLALNNSPVLVFSSCRAIPSRCTMANTLSANAVALQHNRLLAALQNTLTQVANALGTGAVTDFISQGFLANHVSTMDATLDTLKPSISVLWGEAQMFLNVSGVGYVFTLDNAGLATAASGAAPASSVASGGVVTIPRLPAAISAIQATVARNQALQPLSATASEFLTAHNAIRAAVSTPVAIPPLTYSPTLEASAQAWVNNLKNTQACALVHSAGPYGENLFSGWGATFTPTQVVNSWTAEKAFYNYASNSCATGKVCGHYTQIAWRNTTQIGCAQAICPSGTQVWACQYNPPGNYVGQLPY